MSSLEALFDQHINLFDKIAEFSTSASALGVVTNTPKFSGQARASVNYAIGQVDDSVVIVENYQKNAIANTIASARADFNRKSSFLRSGMTVYITSSISYVTAIEYQYGYRPFGKAVQSWQNVVNLSIDKARAVV